MELQWQEVELNQPALIDWLACLEDEMQVALTADGNLSLSSAPRLVYARASRMRAGAVPVAGSLAGEQLQGCALARLVERAAAAGAGVLLVDENLLLGPALVARLARSRLLQHEGQRWLLEYCPRGSALELRDLLALRSLNDVPSLQIWNAVRLDAPEAVSRHERWLLVDQPLRAEQLQRCQARGYRCWTSQSLAHAQPRLSELAAGLPPSQLAAPNGSSARDWAVGLVVIGVLLMAGLFWKAGNDRKIRVAEQNTRALVGLQRLFEGRHGSAVDPLYEALIKLGVPASVGGKVIDLPPPAGLDAQARHDAMHAVLGIELAARLDSFEALESYLQEQAQRIGQRRMILSGEYCQYGYSTVIPLAANRSFVLVVEQQRGADSLKWSGIEHIDSQHLRNCGALGLPRLE